MEHGVASLFVVEVTLNYLGAGRKMGDHLFRRLDLGRDRVRFALAVELCPRLAPLFPLALCEGVLLLQSVLHQSAAVSALLMYRTIRNPYLLLHQFQFLRLQKLLWYTLWACLCAEAEIPQLLAKFGCIFVKEAGKLNLKDFDLGLVTCQYEAIKAGKGWRVGVQNECARAG